MPVFRSEKLRNGAYWVLWQIKESIETMREEVFLTENGQQEWKTLHHPQKQSEWLAGRLAIQALCEQLNLNYQGIEKDPFGKPHLINLPGHISLSNCWPYAGVVYHDQPIGLDIEKIQEKLERIAPKFLDSTELAHSAQNLDKLTLRWSAKEALYKLHGRKQLAFREQLKTGVFSPTEWGFFSAEIIEDTSLPCRIYFEKIPPFHWITVALKRRA